MARSGLMQNLIADIGGAVDTDGAGSHLGDGHDVGERAFGQPAVRHDDLRLYEGQHGVASAEGE